jgi:hypothetical protein
MGAPRGNRNAAGKHNMTGAHKGVALKRWNEGHKKALQWVRDNSARQPTKDLFGSGKPRSTSIGARQFLKAKVTKAKKDRLKHERRMEKIYFKHQPYGF